MKESDLSEETEIKKEKSNKKSEENSKPNILLNMYNVMLSGKVLKKEDILSEFEINDRTFYRYMKNIKGFVKEFVNDAQSNLIGNEIIYNRQKKGYIMTGKFESNLNEKEVLAISKVLLESRGFIKEEIKEILDKILENCVSKDKSNIKKIIGNELVHYVQPEHKSELLDKLWVISNAINKQEVLEISYSKMGLDGKIQDNPTKRKVHPQGILFSEYYFYLTAFMEEKTFEFPTIYRIDRIKDIKFENRKFKIDYGKRFEDGEFRKLIQFMQTGELQRVKFRFTGISIEAVQDRLPNAHIEKSPLGGYIVEAKVFGNGIKMWILSQGKSVEVLEPERFRREIIENIETMREMYY